MGNNYISRSEQERIIALQQAGCSYREIGRELGRDASSVYRIVSGERGAFWKSHKSKTWRCGGCGALIRDYKCRSCELNSRETPQQKNARSVRHWCDQIKAKNRARSLTVLQVINDDKTKSRIVESGKQDRSKNNEQS